MRGGPTIAAALGALLAFASADASAQSAAARREAPVKPFAVTSMESELGVEYHYYGETIRREGGGRVRYSNNYFQEYATGRVRGYVYHPRLLDVQAKLKVGLSQQRLRRSDEVMAETSSSNDELLGYDVRMDFFRDHPVSGTVAATRDERMLMGLFIDRYQVKTESESGTLRWTTRSLQMDLTGTHTETDEFGATSQSHSVSDMLAYGLHHQVGRQMRTDVRYTLQNFRRRFFAETPSGDIESESELESQTLNVNNRFDILNDRKATLFSTARIHDQSNNRDLRTYFLQERLEMQHLPNLRSYATGSVLRNEYRNSTIDTYRGETGIEHELFDSLKSHLDVHGRRTDYGAVTEDRYGVTGRLDYRKRTPLGTLNAGYSRTLDQVDRSGSTAFNEVLDEEHVVNFATPVFLDFPDVVPNSLIVTDEANLITYAEGFDYEVVRQGRRTGIRVRPGGLLADGARVLVDYRIEIDGDLKYLSDDDDLYARHDFDRWLKGLSIYAQRHSLNTHRIENETDPRLLEYLDQTLGARQEWRDYAVSTEYQKYRDDLGGYEQWRNQVEGNHALNGHLRWGWNAGVTGTRYFSRDEAAEDDRSRYYFAGTNINGTIAKTGYWKIEARGMRETGRVDQTIAGVMAKVGYDWRRLSVEGGARFEQYDVFESERERVQLFTTLKWKFSRAARRGRK